MISKKGQGATEYLIILAVVIVIALIVVGAMGGIPGIGTGAKSKASSSFWKSSDIAMSQYVAFAASDNVNVTVRNNLANSITLGTFTIGGGTQTCTSTSLAPGQSTTCTDADGASGCAASGDAFSYDVSIAYTDDETGAGYTYTGEGHKLEGTCAD
jgi:uncharacterized protein (UPF0333 family)